MHNIQKYSYHSHTNFSDGKSTALEMVRQAKALGWTSLGISDHLIVHKNMRQSPSCSINKYMQLEPHIYNVSFADIREKFLRHCDSLRQLAKAENFAIRIGFEIDFFTYNGWLEELDDFLAQLDYDYVITGNHFAFDAACETVYNLTDLPVLSNDKAWLNELLHRHFMTIKQAVDSRRFKFLAHLDYARRVGEDICGETSFKAEKLAVLDSLVATSTGMEISTKGLRRINDFFPASWVLDAAAERNVAMIISDDAHNINELGSQFDLAEQALEKHHITHRLKF